MDAFCLSDSTITSELVKRVNLVQSLEKRGLILHEKEQEIDRKLKPLGITKFYSQGYNETMIPTIYVITPTYTRFTQKADLTRLSQTFLHVPKLHWIVVEDSNNKTDLVSRFLENCAVKYTHLTVRTPRDDPRNPNRRLKARGVDQRNLGLKWIRQNFKDDMKGVVYFGDDDNTYDLKIFEQVSTK